MTQQGNARRERELVRIDTLEAADSQDANDSETPLRLGPIVMTLLLSAILATLFTPSAARAEDAPTAGKQDTAAGKQAAAPKKSDAEQTAEQTAEQLLDYYHVMSVPKPIKLRRGDDFTTHRQQLRDQVLKTATLWPLPKRVPLDVHMSAALDHPWCTVRRVYYQLWSGVYQTGLLYMPKQFAETPAPAMLCPHGHWDDGNAHVDVQKRCLNFARLGYVVFAPAQTHYEDLMIGVSSQTLMIWSNMRALDYLESLPQVDKKRIGAAGCSGGGLQSQMIVGLDDRVRAATIVGLTCDFREIMFPNSQHCDCNHFPRIMQATDHPEISTLGLPSAVQFLTMNDWTQDFKQNNFPIIERLYTINGHGDRVDCQYFNTPHNYDQPKREATYGWMHRWVRGGDSAASIAEPEIQTLPVEKLKQLSAEVPNSQGNRHISQLFAESHGYQTPKLNTPAEWTAYRKLLRGTLEELLGTKAVLPRKQLSQLRSLKTDGIRTHTDDADRQLIYRRYGYPSEAGILVPTIVVSRTLGRDEKVSAPKKRPVTILLSEEGGESLLEATGAARQLALDGHLVVLADVRVYGQMLSTGDVLEGPRAVYRQRRTWQRNGIVWGRPVAGMAVTDIRGVLDGIAERDDADMTRVALRSGDSGSLAIVSIFAGALDDRITTVEANLQGRSFGQRNLPLVSSVLLHGDVLEWSSLLADRKLTLRGLSAKAGDGEWLRAAFAAANNAGGLKIEE